MFASLFILMFLPWLDTSKVRSAVFKPLSKLFFWVLVVDVVILGYIGANPPEGLYLLIGRVATIYYFLHFILVLPVLGYKEKTIPLPISISDSVLGEKET
jgi:ubiquinol-cytochrome c reductase cytochrome b subunit